MNLIIDSGNSFIKLALFAHGEFKEHRRVSIENAASTVDEFLTKNDIKHSILAETRDLEPEVLRRLQDCTKLMRLSSQLDLPFKNCYETPETLGHDRLALAAAAVHLFSKKNVLVIDTGTCITYDLIEAGKYYQGGAISPGLNMRYRAMHGFTQKLPSLNPEGFTGTGLIGKTTEENIHVGALLGTCLEIDGYIHSLKTQYKNLNVVLTGGDTKVLVNRLKNSIFAPSNFLLIGMNTILEFNKVNE